MLKRIKTFHEMGFYHRDIKLNNFTINLPSEDRNKSPKEDDVVVHLIDYGICKKHQLNQAEIQKKL